MYSESNHTDKITIVSFNIEKSREIDLAILELNLNIHTKDSDIILLQEMDEEGVIQIAEFFKLNYIYYPFSRELKTQSNFGNAILSRYKIKAEEKLILPHYSQKNRLRAVTKCSITINNKSLLLYSIHQSTVSLKKSKRADQLETVLSDINTERENYNQVIVGGDFNTLFKKDLKSTITLFEELGFKFATENIGHTSAALFNIVKPKNDHIFTKSGKVINSGKLQDSKSSDHLPIFIELKI